MRIVQACPYDWDAPGGVQVHVRQLAACLRNRGHDVLVLAPARRAAEPGLAIVGAPVRIPYRGTVAPICFSPSSWWRVWRVLRSFRPDLVHVHEPLTPSTSMFGALSSPAPVVATFHAHLDRSSLLAAAAPVLRPVWRRLTGRVAVSEAAAAFVSRFFRGDLVVVPNGVDVGMFAGGRRAEGLPPGRRLLWVNRLDPQKAFPVALRAFAALAPDFPDLSLVVAGDGPDRSALRHLPEEVQRRVVMLGRVRHGELPPYHAACDLFIAPATGQESFGIVLVEAMAAGLPVVASDIPGYREVVRDRVEGLLVPPGDAGALADGVRRLLLDAGLSAGLSAAGRERAQGFAWDAVVERLEAVYRRARGAE